MERGRKSPPGIINPQRPEPPPELDAAEAAIWRSTVTAMRPDWFTPETHPVLRAYCCLAVVSDRLADEARRAMSADDKEFSRAVKRFMSATKQLVVTAAKLRITPLSRMRSGRGEARDPFGGRPRPWEK